jgi:hypothetical protein
MPFGPGGKSVKQKAKFSTKSATKAGRGAAIVIIRVISSYVDQLLSDFRLKLEYSAEIAEKQCESRITLITRDFLCELLYTLTNTKAPQEATSR